MQQSEYRNVVGPLTRDEIKKALTAILKKIGNKESSAEGLADLYCLTRRPEVDIEPYLVKTPLVFQEYIRRGLASHEADAAERRENGAPPLRPLHTYNRYRNATASAEQNSRRQNRCALVIVHLGGRE